MNEVRLEIPEIAEKINLKLKEESPVKLETLESVSIAAPTYHRDLLGLDYESSGHTGYTTRGYQLVMESLEKELRKNRKNLVVI